MWHTCCGGVLTFRNAAGVVVGGDIRFGSTVTPAIASSTANCRPLESTVCSRPLQAHTRLTRLGEHALERQTAGVGAKHHCRLACHDQCTAGTEAHHKWIVDENRVVVLLYWMCKQGRVHTTSVVINDLHKVRVDESGACTTHTHFK